MQQTKAKNSSKSSLALKEELKSWGERSTFHAIPQLSTNERISVKVMWAICLIASAGYCGKVLVKSVTDYWNYDVDTVVEILRDTDADFPTVTFCALHTCGLGSYDVHALLASYANRTRNGTASTMTNENISWANTNLRTIFKLIRDEYLRTSNRDELLKVLRRNKTSIRSNLISCQFSSEFCYENDFEYYELDEFQKCYKFNSGFDFNGGRTAIRKARRYGKSYGLQMELFIGLPANCRSPFSQTFGIMVYVHNNTNAITEDTNGILVAPGSETNIAIDRTFLVRKPDPYSDCIENRKNSNAPNQFVSDAFKINPFSVYSQTQCLQLCHQKFVIDTFSCYDEKLPYIKGFSIVRSADIKPCVSIIDNPDDKTYDPELFYQLNIDDKCFESCPNACEYVEYDMTVSSSQFPTMTYSDVLVYNENISANFEADKSKKQFLAVKSSVLSINVFYKTDLYTNVREKASTELEEFISNFGGAMGLFLGISLLSLVEILEIIYELVASYLEQKDIFHKVAVRLELGGKHEIAED